MSSFPGHSHDRTLYQRVILTGFMGAGKTTVGRLLAPRLSWQFRDTDAVLTERTGSSIARLFSLHGEAGFREQEAALLAELLLLKNTVLALGGGAVEHVETQALLRAALAPGSGSLLVYLEAPLAVAIERCAAEPGAAVRPVLSDRELLARRYQSRLPLYQSAHLVIPSAVHLPDAIAARIAHQLSAGTKADIADQHSAL